jgi:TonB family protein
MVTVTGSLPEEVPVWVSQKRMAFHRVAMKSTTPHSPQVRSVQTLELNELITPTFETSLPELSDKQWVQLEQNRELLPQDVFSDTSDYVQTNAPLDKLASIEGDIGPVALHQPPPIYPKELAYRAISGEVLAEFTVNVQGNTTRIEIVKSSHPGFNKAVVRAIERWTFEPAKKGNKAVEKRMTIPIRFAI